MRNTGQESVPVFRFVLSGQIRQQIFIPLSKGKKNPVLLPNLSCHSLRNTFTTRLVESGVNIKVIQELCGHTRSDVTLDIYTTVTKELKQREFGNFEEKMRNQKLMLKGDIEESE